MENKINDKEIHDKLDQEIKTPGQKNAVEVMRSSPFAALRVQRITMKIFNKLCVECKTETMKTKSYEDFCDRCKKSTDHDLKQLENLRKKMSS